ncbi:tetratricopeptide repeat protein [Neobacillus sp. D3-1R]|uniref:tetratricopeptide repeat protein n=1 Tax=Neobacillus sp. D3-1R TaxID=3445778 RepID=UPI003FA01BD7
MLRAKRSLQRFKETASRQFTDREAPKQSFLKAFHSIQEDRFKVLVFYGVGGIGKSRLLKELQTLTSSLDETAIKVSIDFRDEKHREPSEALIWLRQQLTQEYKIKFTTFDLAYGVYWSKIKPQLTLKSEQKNIPFLEEGDFIGELINQLEHLPVVQWIPKTLKFINGLSQYKEMIQWWSGIGKNVLNDLKDMHPKDIEDMLLVYWASDLIEWLKQNNRKAIFFFDTYEALWEKNRTVGSYSEKDEWIRDLILQFEEVNVLNIICGREKINWGKYNPEWDQYVEQHLIGELSIKDCKSFLNSCGITDELIQDTIIKGSEGLPYYLDLMVDTYQLIQRTRTPVIDDFSKRPEEVLNRFLKYLDRPEQETLKILSFTRFWSEDLFADLVTEFNTFYPITAFHDLCQFSFIDEHNENDYWSMHKLMRVGLQDQLIKESPQIFEQVHFFLYKYYTKQLDKPNPSSNQLVTFFAEGLYHGEMVLKEEELVEWLAKYTIILINHGKWASLIHELEKLLKHHPSKKLHAYCLQNIGEILTLRGQYDLAENHFMEAIKLHEDGLETHRFKNIAQIQKRLGDLYRNTSKYEKSIQAFKGALLNLEKFRDDIRAVQDMGYISIRLGKIYKLLSDYVQAKRYYENALELCNPLILSNNAPSAIYAILGESYEKLAEMISDEEKEKDANSINYLVEAIKAYDVALQDKDMVDYIPILAHKGLAHKRLAEYFSKDTQAKEKLDHFHKAIEIYNEVIRLAPDYVNGHEMRGHAAADLLRLQIELELFSEGMESFQLAVQSFEGAIALSNKQGSSLNRLSSSYRLLGKLYRKQKNYSLALENYELAVQKSDQVLINAPEYIYAHNSRGKLYKEMGDCYSEIQDTANARKYYKEAQSCFETSLVKSPHSKLALRYKEEIKILISQL